MSASVDQPYKRARRSATCSCDIGCTEGSRGADELDRARHHLVVSVDVIAIARRHVDAVERAVPGSVIILALREAGEVRPESGMQSSIAELKKVHSMPRRRRSAQWSDADRQRTGFFRGRKMPPNPGCEAHRSPGRVAVGASTPCVPFTIHRIDVEHRLDIGHRNEAVRWHSQDQLPVLRTRAVS